MTKEEKLIKAAKNAHMVIGGFYQWLDMVDAEGGATSISGVAKCNAMLKSMRDQRKRIDELVSDPLIEAIEEFTQ